MHLEFGAFLAPHHPLGEHPTLQFRRDLEFAAHLDRLGFEEFWVGEHHSSGWEMIASPEMFLAAAGEHTERIRLGTGVVSLPYHHPFNVAQRMVQLDHMTRGRAMFGSGPGALPSDARTLGIEPMRSAIARTRRSASSCGCSAARSASATTASGSRCATPSCRSFRVQSDMPVTVASSISPSGMQLAGKYGIGVLSIASTSTEGIQALPTQWGFAEEAAALHGQTVDRRELACVDGVAPRRDRATRPSPKRCTVCTAGTTSTTCTCSAVPAPNTSRTRWSCSNRQPAQAQRAPARP